MYRVLYIYGVPCVGGLPGQGPGAAECGWASQDADGVITV
jgi:hypothetical protein